MEVYILTVKREGSDLVNVGAFDTKEKAIKCGLKFAIDIYEKSYGPKAFLGEETKRDIETVFRTDIQFRGSSTMRNHVYAIVQTKVV